MFTIRQGLMDVLAASAERVFEEQAMEHCLKYWPEECQALGEEGVRETVRDAMDKASQYAIDEEYDILRLLNLMFALGRHFDYDPGYPWAAAILGDTTQPARDRMDALSARTGEELNGEDQIQT